MQIPSEQDIDLDLVKQRLIVVYANQTDNDGESSEITNLVHCHIFNNGEIQDLSGYNPRKIILNIKRKDGTAYTISINELGGTVSGNTITFPINSEMTALYGRNICNFRLEISDDVKYSCNFYMRVYKSAVEQSEISTSNEFHDINEKYNETQEQMRLMANEYVTTTSTPPASADDNDFWTEFIN